MKWLLLLWAGSVACAFQVPIDILTRLRPDLTDTFDALDNIQFPIDISQYDNKCVVRLDSSIDALNLLKQSGASIWKRSANSIDAQVDSSVVESLQRFNPHVIIPDLAQAVLDTFPSETEPMEMSVLELQTIHDLSDIFFKQYRRLDTIHAWILLLQETYPDIIRVEDIGETYEGRPFRVVHLSVPDDSVNHEDKKTIVVTGGVHAREWISVLTVLYSIYGMLRHYEENPHDSKTLAKLDFLFIPVLNPDGYDYTWTHDRLWRKNRQDTGSGDCVGIDIDHSFDYHWTRSQDSPCGEEYSGEEPFQAYELKIWDNYLNQTNHEHKIYGYVDLHSYDQEILYPYAYSCQDVPKDQENLIELAYGISKSIRISSGKYYAVSPACLDRDSDLLPDLGSGTALDYMYHQHAYWAYQLKLRDAGSHGFLLPEKYIIPVGEEIIAGFKYFCKFILSDER